ncbi:MAG: membrane protein [Candidatus Kapaibacteriales bacterium]
MRNLGFIVLKLGLMIVLFVASFAAFSQGGSNYSTIGYGDITDGRDAYYDGFAGAITAIPNQEHINPLNPAMWTYNKTTRLQFGYRFNQQLVESNESSLYQNNGMVDNFSVMFALDTATGFSAAMGLRRVTDINYYIANPFSISKDGLGLSGNVFHQADGGMNNAFLGTAYRLPFGLALGGVIGYYFGDVEQTVQTVFDQSIASATDYQRESRITGLNYRFGVDYQLNESLNLAAFYASDPGLSVDTRLISFSLFSASGINIDTLDTTESDAIFPQRLGLGASYTIDRLLFSADYQMTMADGVEFRQPQNGEMVNGFSFAVGAERRASRFASARFGERVSYRLGLGYTALPYSISGEQINEYMLGAGLTLPLPGTALIDLGLQAGQRGTIKSGLVKESFIRMNFSLSIGDTWFIPFERDFD